LYDISLFYTGSVYDRAYPYISVACLYSLFVNYSILCGTVMTWNLSIILFYFYWMLSDGWYIWTVWGSAARYVVVLFCFIFIECYLTDDTYGRDIWVPYLFIVLW